MYVSDKYCIDVCLIDEKGQRGENVIYLLILCGSWILNFQMTQEIGLNLFNMKISNQIEPDESDQTTIVISNSRS